MEIQQLSCAPQKISLLALCVHVDRCRSTTKTSRSEALDKKIAKIQVRLASARERLYSYRSYFDPIKFFACAMPIFGEIAKRVGFNVHIYLH